MEKNAKIVSGARQHKLFIRSYRSEKTNKGVIQILHGMAECGDSYDRFATFMAEKGYIVYVQDHRKHGKSLGENQKVGYYTDDTWEDMLDDIDYIQKYILEQENVSKIILLGHSMGSFLCRNYLIKYGENISKAIIIGTAYGDPVTTKSGVALAKLLESINSTKPSNLLHYMTIGRHNKGKEPGRKDFDWLTRDEAIVERYTRDEMCGFVYTPRFYSEMAKGLRIVSTEKYVAKTVKIPLLFIAGLDDPVGDYGKGVKKVVSIYDKLGYDTTTEFIEGGRHDVLNEINKEEIYEMILSFI